MLASLIQRRDLARAKLAAGDLGPGSTVYWQTIELDAAMLAAWVADSDVWAFEARQQQSALERSVAALDAVHTPALPERAA
jgi:hypothetical protein